jgi:hypothetical protein
MMQIQVDGNNNKFFSFKNVRVSVKHPKEAGKDWEWGDGTGRYLQILAYRDATSTTTFPGPQIPIEAGLSDEQVLAIAWGMLNAATNK